MKKVFVLLMLLVAFGVGAQTISGTLTGTNGKYSMNLTAPKIKDYVNVKSDDLEKLDVIVKGMIRDGWVPLGPVSVIAGRSWNSYVQTMVKY